MAGSPLTLTASALQLLKQPAKFATRHGHYFVAGFRYRSLIIAAFRFRSTNAEKLQSAVASLGVARPKTFSARAFLTFERAARTLALEVSSTVFTDGDGSETLSLSARGGEEEDKLEQDISRLLASLYRPYETLFRHYAQIAAGFPITIEGVNRFDLTQTQV